MSQPLTDILKTGFIQAKLAPFYIITLSNQTPNSRGFLNSWITELLSQIIAGKRGCSNEAAEQSLKNGHPDILWPPREDPTVSYSLKEGDLDELFNFLQYNPMELDWRFVVIEDPHKIGDIYLNKLLKTLEEPPAKTSILFLDHQKTTFLKTIHSRASEFSLVDKKWQLSSTTELQTDGLKSWLEKRKELYPLILGSSELSNSLHTYLNKGTGIGELIDTMKYIKDADEELAGLIVEYEACRPGRIEQKEKLCQELIWFSESKSFNNPNWERMLGLLNLAYS